MSNKINDYWSLMRIDYASNDQARLENTFLNLDEVFPLVDPEDPRHQDHFYTDAWFNLDLRAQYKRDARMRAVMNDYMLHGTTLNRWMEMGFKHVVHVGGSFRIGINGPSRSGKSILLLGGVARVYAEVARRALLVHGIPEDPQQGPARPAAVYLWDVNECSNTRRGVLEEWPDQPPVNVHLTFNEDGIRRALGKVKRGDIVCSDEMSKVTGQMSSEISSNLTNIMEAASGQQGINFAFINPSRKEVTGIQLYLYVFGYNAKRNVTRALVTTPEGGWQGVWEVYTLDPLQLREFYKAQAARYKIALLEQRGKISVTQDDSREHELAKALIDKFLASGLPKVAMRTLEYMAREGDLAINAEPEPVIARVIKRAHDELKFKILPSRKEAKGGEGAASEALDGSMGGQVVLLDRPLDFHVTDAELLKTYPDLTRAQQYLEIKYSGTQYYKIAEAYNKTPAWASMLANPKQPDPDFPTKGIPGWLAQERGNRFEDEVQRLLEAEYGSEIVSIDHEQDPAKRHGKPDFVVRLTSGRAIVVAVKCLSSPEGDARPTHSMRVMNKKVGGKGTLGGKFQREITVARELAKAGVDVEMRALIYNMRHQRWGFDVIDHVDPPDLITAKVAIQDDSYPPLDPAPQ